MEYNYPEERLFTLCTRAHLLTYINGKGGMKIK